MSTTPPNHLIPVGFGGAAFSAAQNALVQQESPPDMRDRKLARGAVAFLGSTPTGAPSPAGSPIM